MKPLLGSALVLMAFGLGMALWSHGEDMCSEPSRADA